ncbi:BON domain-containing protein [Chryseosolibacter indicus]|uniref:BON domain-containing protein n=1 Tax=Chryseosolibacter indicus TaxID=2782351 RepID=A0ABS5VLC5_9BACT|nr:BON domain-containing protein [Chryseosolibacter indicus]MBT1701798.1 BON domain-containing protein [Chryseosolibacter indicus]
MRDRTDRDSGSVGSDQDSKYPADGHNGGYGSFHRRRPYRYGEDQGYSTGNSAGYPEGGNKADPGNYSSYSTYSRGTDYGPGAYGHNNSPGNDYGSFDYKNNPGAVRYNEHSNQFDPQDYPSFTNQFNRSNTKTGLHKGKGPRGYTRSDERVLEEINERITEDPYIDALEVTVAVQGGEVILTGSVSDRAEKRRAEDIAESVSGVTHVENRLRVISGSVRNDS